MQQASEQQQLNEDNEESSDNAIAALNSASP
jgi:hypothetical protein